LDSLAAARKAYEQHDWAAARAAFRSCHADQPLGPEDSERMAWGCRWSQDAHGFLDWLERAEVAYCAQDDRRGAARMALEQARHHKQMLKDKVAMTAHGRALEYLEDLPESPEHAQALWSMAWVQAELGDLGGAKANLREALVIARRTGDPGVEATVLQGLAHMEVADGHRNEGLALLDQATALAMSPSAAPIHSGHVYCATISVCRSVCDWERATEWTDVSTRWCERESITGYSGLCRFHRAEIERVHGHLANAEQEVLRACEELLRINRYGAAWGFSELVDIRVRRGDLDGAEDALGRAIELGGDGQPGRGRLQLARGMADAAVRGLERALASPALLAREARVFILPVHVTAAIAVGALEKARASVDELALVATQLGTDAPAASAAVARGELALAEGAIHEAVSNLRDGIRGWCEIDAPYEAAQARVLLGGALQKAGDDDEARLELGAALRSFTDVGATRDADHVAQLLEPHEQNLGSVATRTFLFSDIVGSTQLVEAMGDETWQHLLAWHDRTLRSVFVGHDGEEVKHAGDGFFVAFDDPDAALECGCAIQRALADHRREHGFAPHVRIGLHAGVATARENDYFGRVVNQTARIAAQARADEVLASAALVDQCVRPRAIGERRSVHLKGFADPVEVAVVAVGR